MHIQHEKPSAFSQQAADRTNLVIKKQKTTNKIVSKPLQRYTGGTVPTDHQPFI
jgi:hypothetical protein